jgi:hypothetical protein
VRQPGAGLAHRLCQRIDDGTFDPVGQVPAVGDVLEAAPSVGDFLVLGQRVGDQREGAQICLERLGERKAGLLPPGAIGVLQQRQRHFERQRLVINGELEAAHGLIKKPVPGCVPGHRLFVEELLDPVFELEGPVQPEIMDPGCVARGARILAEALLDQRIIDAVELEREEQKMGADICHRALHIAIELGDCRIGGVGEVSQARIGNDPPHQFL